MQAQNGVDERRQLRATEPAFAGIPLLELE